MNVRTLQMEICGHQRHGDSGQLWGVHRLESIPEDPDLPIPDENMSNLAKKFRICRKVRPPTLTPEGPSCFPVNSRKNPDFRVSLGGVQQLFVRQLPRSWVGPSPHH